MKTLLLLLFLVPATYAQTFVENGGVVEIEAEGHFTNIVRNIGGQDYAWTNSTAIAGASGSYMEALPNNNVNRSTDWITSSPEMRYNVNFNLTGTHYVWIRGYGATADDDSVHIGHNGTTNTAAAMSLTQTGMWQWSTNRTGFATRGTINVAATGVQTIHAWMREDGMRLDKILLTTNVNFQATLGNVFHIADGIETGAGGLTMRSPLGGMATEERVFLYTGNQFQGPGNAGNQVQTGSTIYYKHVASNSWNAVPMIFWYEGGATGNNKYYSNSIPANIFSPGDTVQYYFRIPYTDRLTTFVGGNNIKYELEADAQANPNMFTYQWLAAPSGSVILTSKGSGSDQVHGRIYQDSGHYEIFRQAFDGTERGATNVFMPSWALVNGNSFVLGPATLVSNTINGVVFRQSFGLTSVVARIHFPHTDDRIVQYEVLDWGGPTPKRNTVTGLSHANEHFYGFGEKFNTFDQAGRKVRIMALDPPGNKGDNAYKVHPWFVSTDGYGFHFDGSAESFFDMRAAVADKYIVDYLAGTLRFNVVSGPMLTDVLSRYTGYTGRPEMTPPWAYAPWMSSDIWRSGGEVRYLISKYREHGIPGSALVFDSPWEIAYNDFTWNMTQFGNGGTFEGTNYAGFGSVGDMMTFLRTNGFKVICWMTPFVNTNSNVEHTGIYGGGGVPGQNTGKAANYDEGAASNYFVRVVSGGATNTLVVPWWKGNGSPVDFTHPGARQWISNQLSNLIAQSGNVIGGFKTDDGEMGHPEGLGAHVYIPPNALYADGRTGVEMRNGYCVEYHKTIWNVLGTNGILFARSGFTGSQKYPGYWAGDNEPNFG